MKETIQIWHPEDLTGKDFNLIDFVLLVVLAIAIAVFTSPLKQQNDNGQRK